MASELEHLEVKPGASLFCVTLQKLPMSQQMETSQPPSQPNLHTLATCQQLDGRHTNHHQDKKGLHNQRAQ